MSIGGHFLRLANSVWTGNQDMWGDAVGMQAELAHAIPLVGEHLPDGEEASSFVNRTVLGHGERREQSGNAGNHIGAVLGALAGSGLGPVGAAGGAALGSSAGGWIANRFR